MQEASLYNQLGETNLKLMVDNFYDLVLENEVISDLFQSDINEVKRKQFMFLSQFLGGPSLYVAEFGHPRMRMRHMPHKITPSGAIAWLDCMRKSIESLDIPVDLQAKIFQRFPNVAAHMVNSND
ncbi:globin [Saprospiraceae bacterium]|nr:globin [Saprospiraceae bacterium]